MNAKRHIIKVLILVVNDLSMVLQSLLRQHALTFE